MSFRSQQLVIAILLYPIYYSHGLEVSLPLLYGTNLQIFNPLTDALSRQELNVVSSYIVSELFLLRSYCSQHRPWTSAMIGEQPSLS